MKIIKRVSSIALTSGRIVSLATGWPLWKKLVVAALFLVSHLTAYAIGLARGIARTEAEWVAANERMTNRGRGLDDEDILRQIRREQKVNVDQ
jgi:hypothetical protein